MSKTRYLMSIIWEDAYFMDKFLPDEESDSGDHVPLNSSGFLIEVTKKALKIGGEYKEDDNQWRYVLVVPRKYIKKLYWFDCIYEFGGAGLNSLKEHRRKYP